LAQLIWIRKATDKRRFVGQFLEGFKLLVLLDVNFSRINRAAGKIEEGGFASCNDLVDLLGGPGFRDSGVRAELCPKKPDHYVGALDQLLVYRLLRSNAGAWRRMSFPLDRQ
jgi:hypothetical protein